MNAKNTSKAVWICDESFVLPTALSIHSFVTHWKVDSVDLIFCGEPKPELQAFFFELDSSIRLVRFCPTLSEDRTEIQRKHILNRLARMYALEQAEPNSFLFLIDSDTIFSSKINQLSEHIDFQKPPEQPTVWGVEEFEHAWDAYLYFASSTNAGGQVYHRSKASKYRVFESVFGEEWEVLLEPPQFNNGFLLFYNPSELATSWRHYYQTGLQYAQVNPLDDQLPLAAALSKTKTDRINLPALFNSKGATYGDYAMYHAWLGRWDWDLVKLQTEQTHLLSDYGQLAGLHYNLLPNTKPKLAQNQYGSMFWWLGDWLKTQSKGLLVEVNAWGLYSTFFLAESKAHYKFDYQLVWDTRNPEGLQVGRLMYTLKKNGFWEDLTVFFDHPLEAYQNYEDGSISCLVVTPLGEMLGLSPASWLGNWLPKLAVGAKILICGFGIDKQVLAAFCQAQGGELEIGEGVFLLNF